MPCEFKELAAYNSRARDGIVHTAEYAARMAVLQERFDAWHEDQIRREGFMPLAGKPGAWVKQPRAAGTSPPGSDAP